MSEQPQPFVVRVARPGILRLREAHAVRHGLAEGPGAGHAGQLRGAAERQPPRGRVGPAGVDDDEGLGRSRLARQTIEGSVEVGRPSRGDEDRCDSRLHDS
nr:hypothetical protein GCM10025699_46700 [Microbacterium flavescens]